MAEAIRLQNIYNSNATDFDIYENVREYPANTMQRNEINIEDRDVDTDRGKCFI